MARQTEVVLLLLLATAATAFANIVKPRSAEDFDKIINEAKERRVNSKCSTCCPFGWVKYERRCFMYQAISMDWVSAEKHCQNLGANLVSMHSESEYQLVKALIRAHDPQENPAWLGLSACQKRNVWFWSDGTKLTYTKWNPTEPNFYINGECCALINYNGRKDWIDGPCEWRYHFVCAKRHI